MLFVVPPAGAQTDVDYDANDNRLIEIDSLAKLDAIRHDLDGDGLQGTVGASDWMVYTAAFPNALSTQCPGGCQGYELMADLDFDENGDGTVDGSDHGGLYHHSGNGWNPIGGTAVGTTYATRFDGNGHTISNLFISRSGFPAGTDLGLFRRLGATGYVEFLGLANASVSGHTDVGILAGELLLGGVAHGIYTTGSVSGTQRVGGITGRLYGEMRASYSTASVTASSTGHLGGLTGRLHEDGVLTASYSAGSTAGSTTNTGGLVGDVDGGTITASYTSGTGSGSGGLVGGTTPDSTVTASYYDRERRNFSDTDKGLPKTTRELQTPTSYDDLYQDWNVDLDGDDNPDDPWDFGSPRHYPALKVDFDGNGTATCREFGPQRCYREPGPPPYNWRADHPESYANARTGITASCAVMTTGTGDAAITTSTLTFDLAEYTRP